MAVLLEKFNKRTANLSGRQHRFFLAEYRLQQRRQIKGILYDLRRKCPIKISIDVLFADCPRLPFSLTPVRFFVQSPGMISKSPKFQLVLISAGLVLLILVVFEPLRHNGFVNYDDPLYIVENPHIQYGFTTSSILWAFTSGYATNWHPLTWLSHMLDIELFGLNPLGHHLHNLLLHIASTILLFWLLHNMTGAVWRSTFVAMAFGIHPLRVESVAWVAERKDVLSMLFFMLTVAAYLYYVKQGGILRYLLVVLCFALGLMAKPMLVTLPFVLLLLDFWPLRRIHKNVRRLIVEKIPLLILTIASCIITYSVQKASASSFSFYSRATNALVNYVAYLGKLFWPHNLAVLYPYPPSAYPLWLTAAALTILLILSVFIIYNRSKWPFLFTGWFWYIITLVPVIGFVKVGNQSMADRYMYLPSIGISIMLSWSAAQLSAKLRHQKIIMGILIALAGAAMAIGTCSQVALWKDSVTLFKYTLAVTQNNAVIHNNLCWPLWKQGKEAEATEHIQKALQLSPAYPDANINMAAILLKHRQYDKVADYLRKVLITYPTNAKANLNMAYIFMGQKNFDEAERYLRNVLMTDAANAEAYYNMGIILEARGKTDEAIHAYEEAVKLNRNHFQAMCDLGVLKFQQGFLEEALSCFRQSIQINPDYGPAHYNLGSILQKQGKFEEAISSYLTALETDPNNLNTWSNLALSQQTTGHIRQAVDSYHKALELDPNSIPILNNLAWILATTPDTQIRNPAQAASLADKMHRLTSSENPEILDTLAAAYAAAGQFKEAIETAQKAIDLANAAGQKSKTEEISKRLQLYQASKPYSEPISPNRPFKQEQPNPDINSN
jgi:tetratricopeptide (TPR) repeat protein